MKTTMTTITTREAKKMLLQKFNYLRKFYKTKKEFEKHLFSGEVTISIKDLVKIFSIHEPDL